MIVSLWANLLLSTTLLGSSLVAGSQSSAVQIRIGGKAPTSTAFCVEEDKQTILHTVGNILISQDSATSFPGDWAEFCNQICFPAGAPGELCTAMEVLCNEEQQLRRGLRRRSLFELPQFLFGDQSSDGGDSFFPTDDFFTAMDDADLDNLDLSSIQAVSGTPPPGVVITSSTDAPTSAPPTPSPTATPTASPTVSPCEISSISQQIVSELSSLISPECMTFVNMKFKYKCF